MKGSYILLLKVDKNVNLKIGSLGTVKFRKGVYAYVGSAMNGIENRLKRHSILNKIKSGKLKWHIDYLLVNRYVRIIKTIPISTKKRSECIISKLLEKKAVDVVSGFGSTDCKLCRGHLYVLAYSKTC